MYTVPPPLIGAIIGLGMHHGLFIRGEWHVQAPYILVSHFLGFFYLVMMIEHGWQLISGYLVALFASIIIYRIFFHRLKHFPGPFWAPVTKICHIWKARNCKNHFYMSEVQKEYGDFVRTGPSEITVFHPDVFMAVDGPLSNCGKAEWYDLLHPKKALVTARTKDIHRDRRRQWNRGFTSHALVHYKEQILELISHLEKGIQADIAAGRVSDVSNFVYWLSFDRMGEFVLGKSFDMLTDGRWHHIILLLQKAMSLLGPMSPVPWLVQIAFRLMPRVWVINDWFTMVGWCESQLRQIQPVEKSSRRPVLADYLTSEDPNDKTFEGWLTGDSVLAIVAGSEPTAGVLVGLFYELAKNPAEAEIIYDEIVQNEVDITDGRDVARKCPHIEAAILEALRLYPSLPSGGQRKTPRGEGITVGGVFIPPETTVVSPRFVIGRREDCFVNANQFIPERWTTCPEMVLNKAAHAPFGTGHRSCLGRALAMNDMSLIIAHIVRRYRMRFPAGETGEHVFNDWNDRFTSNLGQLRLIFEKRED